MDKMFLDHTVETSKVFDEAVKAVELETAKARFKVLHVHDVKKID